MIEFSFCHSRKGVFYFLFLRRHFICESRDLRRHTSFSNEIRLVVVVPALSDDIIISRRFRNSIRNRLIRQFRHEGFKLQEHRTALGTHVSGLTASPFLCFDSRGTKSAFGIRLLAHRHCDMVCGRKAQQTNQFVGSLLRTVVASSPYASTIWLMTDTSNSAFPRRIWTSARTNADKHAALMFPSICSVIFGISRSLRGL